MLGLIPLEPEMAHHGSRCQVQMTETSDREGTIPALGQGFANEEDFPRNTPPVFRCSFHTSPCCRQQFPVTELKMGRAPLTPLLSLAASGSGCGMEEQDHRADSALLLTFSLL